ncbi:major facilitator superfamily domain-containing protein [Lophiotrema nucula]|uniref:Major facilitator superfamily domain-containing protein n=1 Tax=Lophiotrema nucula TaxID=690887 RepID=A0A6A5Z4B5_9PLEO|nr:major facilitator superfamily domain-containing protein [Lophiotrema nucula]
MWRTLSTCFYFMMMGANDAAYGALIPYIEDSYGLSDMVVSLLFLSPVVGYSSAALLNSAVHNRWGQRGVAVIGPTCHVLAYIAVALHPPYPILVVVFVFAGFANGLGEAAWNAFLGNMANSNEVLGFLHGFYGLGAALSPIAATSLIEKAGWLWYAFYYIMIGGAVLELATSLSSFWHLSGRVYREARSYVTVTDKSYYRQSLKKRVTWIMAIYLFVYNGIEVGLGGWIVTFMRRERSGQPFESGIVAMGYWIGIMLGRFALGFLTPRLGEKFAAILYMVLSILCQLLFWLVPEFHVSAVAVSLHGFFLGPLFPAAVVVARKSLPAQLYVPALGFAVASSGGGGGVLPFAIGALAQAKGVSIFPPVTLAMLIVILILWVCLPTLDKSSTQQDDKEGQWKNIDIDLVHVSRRTIVKLRDRR